MRQCLSSLIYTQPACSPFLPRHLRPLQPSRHLLTHLCALPPSVPSNSVYTLAEYVPEFPRLGDPIRDFIAPDVPQLTGFNADDFTRLFLPDLIQPANIYTFLLFLSCAVAFVYLELGVLLDGFLQEQDFEKLEEDYLEDAKTGKKQEDRQQQHAEEGTIERDIEAKVRAKKAFKRAKMQAERKRGLGWLALVTALAVWTTGLMNKINPFQP